MIFCTLFLWIENKTWWRSLRFWRFLHSSVLQNRSNVNQIPIFDKRRQERWFLLKILNALFMNLWRIIIRRLWAFPNYSKRIKWGDIRLFICVLTSQEVLVFKSFKGLRVESFPLYETGRWTTLLAWVIIRLLALVTANLPSWAAVAWDENFTGNTFSDFLLRSHIWESIMLDLD